MKILFCNITYMNEYVGNIEKDMPHGGGLYVEKYNDAHEQWNFLNYDGECRGFVMNKGDEFHIERLDGVSKKDEIAKDVTIVWCANKTSSETVIVGWYENATVYRFYQETSVSPLYGIERSYFTTANADDCCLLPESKRTFKIDRASVKGKGKGIGRANVWYAESQYARENIIPEVLSFIENNRQFRINKTNANFDEPLNISEKLSTEEKKTAESLYEDENYFDFIPLGYRIFNESKDPDDLYNIATALGSCYQFKKAINLYEKLIEIEGLRWDNSSFLPYMCAVCEEYERAIDWAKEILKLDEAKDNDVKMEIYGILADNNNAIGNLDEAVKYLDKIIDESKDRSIAEHAIYVKKCWLE